MPKWKKGETEFKVAVNYVDKRGYSSSIPKPVMMALGEPKTLKFVIDNSGVRVQSDNESDTVEAATKINMVNPHKTKGGR